LAKLSFRRYAAHRILRRMLPAGFLESDHFVFRCQPLCQAPHASTSTRARSRRKAGTRQSRLRFRVCLGHQLQHWSGLLHAMRALCTQETRHLHVNPLFEGLGVWSVNRQKSVLACSRRRGLEAGAVLNCVTRGHQRPDAWPPQAQVHPAPLACSACEKIGPTANTGAAHAGRREAAAAPRTGPRSMDAGLPRMQASRHGACIGYRTGFAQRSHTSCAAGPEAAAHRARQTPLL